MNLSQIYLEMFLAEYFFCYLVFGVTGVLVTGYVFSDIGRFTSSYIVGSYRRLSYFYASIFFSQVRLVLIATESSLFKISNLMDVLGFAGVVPTHTDFLKHIVMKNLIVHA